MTRQDEEPLSPTVAKVLDEYLAALHADEDIDNEMSDRLDGFLRKGKAPKPDEFESILFPTTEENKP